MRKLFLIMMTLVAFSWNLAAQTKSVSGTVVDAANNEPLIGATVMPIGGGQGAATDIDGNFRVVIPEKVTEIEIRSVGFTPRILCGIQGADSECVSCNENQTRILIQ